MEQTDIHFRTDSTVKEQALAVLDRLGIDLSAAFDLYLRQIIAQQTLPFQLTAPDSQETKEPDALTDDDLVDYENEADDPFYSPSNLEFLQRGIAELNAGRVVQKTMEDLETMALEAMTLEEVG